MKKYRLSTLNNNNKDILTALYIKHFYHLCCLLPGIRCIRINESDHCQGGEPIPPEWPALRWVLHPGSWQKQYDICLERYSHSGTWEMQPLLWWFVFVSRLCESHINNDPLPFFHKGIAPIPVRERRRWKPLRDSSNRWATQQTHRFTFTLAFLFYNL